ncbi:MAG TPA: YbjN domain-containing protein [Gemmatimonadales bacterium]|nr:YbjN domain-containing protein [Gemmatimonadales bacterium]
MAHSRTGERRNALALGSTKRVALALLALSGLSALGVARAQAPSTPSYVPKVARLLDGSGFPYVKRADSVWTIEFHRENLKTFQAIIAPGGDLLVTFVIMAKNAQLNVTPEFMNTLLHLNHELDYVKVGLDNDGDLFVRCDLALRILDEQEFKHAIGQLAASADQAYGRVNSFISTQ